MVWYHTSKLKSIGETVLKISRSQVWRTDRRTDRLKDGRPAFLGPTLTSFVEDNKKWRQPNFYSFVGVYPRDLHLKLGAIPCYSLGWINKSNTECGIIRPTNAIYMGSHSLLGSKALSKCEINPTNCLKISCSQAISCIGYNVNLQTAVTAILVFVECPKSIAS